MDNSDHQSCIMTANSDLTFMSCNQNAYVYKSVDLLNGDATKTNQSQFNITLTTLPLSSVRNNNEINKQGSITYFNQNNNKAYRVSLSSQSGSIVQEELFTIDSRALGNNYIDDMLITKDMVIVKFSNSTFYSYNRPQQQNLVLYNPRAARITYSSVQQLTFQFIQVDSQMQDFYLYSSPNIINSNNVLYQHLIQPRYSNGQVVDVAITLVNTINLRDMLMTASKFTTNIVAFGCPSCNNLVGRVEFYDRAMLNQGSLVIVRTVSGTSNNLQYGQVIEAVDNGNQLIFYVGSSTSGSQTQRQFYLNALMFQRFASNSSLGYQQLSQTVRNVVALPQNGILISMLSSGNMLLKYQGNRGIFSILSCPQSSYYIQDNECIQCAQQEYPFQLNIQSSSCSNCAEIWYAQRKNTATSFYNAIYDNRCQSFDPRTLPDYNNYTNGGGDNGGGNGGQNPTDGGNKNLQSSSSGDGGIGGGAIAGIVIGILVILVGIGIGVYCYLKKKKQENESQEVREKRIQKQKDKQEKVQQAQANRAAKQKSMNEQQSKRIQKKMEKEEIDKVKEQEEKLKQKKLKEQQEQEEKRKKKEQEDKIKQQANLQSQSTSKIGNNVTGVEGPIDLESQYYQKPPLNAKNGNKLQKGMESAAKRPGGEVQDPNDIDVDFSESEYSDEYSDHVDDDHDGSGISQERRNPDRINSIQNRQEQNNPTISNNNTQNTKNLITTQPQSSSYKNPGYLTNAQVKQQTSTTTVDKNNNKLGIQPIQPANNRQNNNIKSSNSSVDSQDKLEEKKSTSKLSTDDKFKNQLTSSNSNQKSQVNNNNGQQQAQKKMFNQNDDNSADIIEDDDESFTDSDDE